MTDFEGGMHLNCYICGQRYYQPEGKFCLCWVCSNCGEGFSDHDMLGNAKEWLCLHCENERMQAEVNNA